MRKAIYYQQGQDKAEIVSNVLLPVWKEYCNRNWLNDKKTAAYSPEQMVKRFLDGCAYLLLRDNPEGTLSIYKEISRGSTEIPVSSCPAQIEDFLYGSGCAPEENETDQFGIMTGKLNERAKTYRNKKAPKPKKRPLTRFEKIEAIKRELPGCRIEIHEVDTENIFGHGGFEYRVSDEVMQYQPRKTREGILFDMDRVVVVESCDGMLRFYDQSLDRIPEDKIMIENL